MSSSTNESDERYHHQGDSQNVKRLKDEPPPALVRRLLRVAMRSLPLIEPRVMQLKMNLQQKAVVKKLTATKVAVYPWQAMRN